MTPDNQGNQPSPNQQRPASQPNSYPAPPQPYQPYNQNYESVPAYQPAPVPGKPPKRPKNPLLLWGGLIGGLLALAAITILVIIPLFNRSTRTEADPFAVSNSVAAVAATAPNMTTSSVVTTTAAVSTTTAISTTTSVKNTVGTTTVASSTAAAETGNAPRGAAPTTAAPAATTAPAKTTSAARIIGKGEFTKIDAIHYARGTATVGISADGKKVLRFDNFTSNQGPDLKVYLGIRPDGSQVKDGGLNLGALPATDGSYNINLPDNADLSKYKSVVIWCEAFSVAFSVASLS